MMVMIPQLVFFLSMLVSVKVSGEVFKMVGDSVQLDIQKPVHEFEELFWTFNQSTTLVIYFKMRKTTKRYSGFKKQVEFNQDTHSLMLKNLQRNGSGYYQATISGAQNHIVAKYSLSVLEQLETPVLTAEPHHNNDTCFVTLTCRSGDLSINSSCFNETCEWMKVASPRGFNLILLLSETSIVCNVSNPISWKTSSKKMYQIKQICSPKDNKDQNIYFYLIMLGLVLSILIFVSILVYAIQRKKNKTGLLNFDITPEFQNTEDSPKTFKMLRNTRGPFTLYSTVRKPTQTSNSENTRDSKKFNYQRQLERPVGTDVYSTVAGSKPETIYGTVNKIDKPSKEG